MTAQPHTDLEAAAARIDDFGISYIELPRLAQPTPPGEVKQRPGPHSKNCERPCNVRHTPLDYVDARYVMETLDRIVGPENWQRDHRMTEGGKVACGIGINVSGVGWVWKWDGAGETDIEGEKGSFSDSFKRAAVSWGIARDLYDKDRDRGPVQAQGAPQRLYDGYEGEVRETRPAQPRQPAEAGGDVCPFHNKPWRNGKYGYFCSSKAAPNGPSNKNGYCDAKPSQAWAAAHEID